MYQIQDDLLRFLRFAGVTSDSSRPHLGAFMILLGLVLLAMQFKTDHLTGAMDVIEHFFTKLGEFLKRADNIAGLATTTIGYRMVFLRNQPTVRPTRRPRKRRRKTG